MNTFLVAPMALASHPAPELRQIAAIAAAAPAKRRFQNTVAENLNSPARMLNALFGKPTPKPAQKAKTKPKSTAENRRRLDALTTGVLPPSKPRNTSNNNRF